MDESRLFSPGSDGTYLVFPTLAPFAEPPPAGGRTAAEAAAILGSDANPAIYDADDPVLRHASARFRLSVRYRVRVDGGASSISLGAFGIREGSERITLGGRPLRLGLDYTIDYTLGTVTLTNPNLLLEGGGELRATWEQAAAFDVAPRTLAGVTARTALGDAGRLELVGLWHAEETLHARPALGLEPAALLLGGATGEVEFGAPWLDRVAALAPGDDDVASKIRVTGELAASLPDPNRRGQAWLDDFEDVAALPIALERHRWRLGSRPDDTLGDDGVLPRPMDETNVATLVWQHDIDQGGGRIGGALLPSEIDRAIRVAGPERGEPALYLTLDGEPDRVRWRSITTVLDPTGRDLSGSEVLEFYVAADESRNLALILDLGDVSEDVFTVDRHGRTGGVRADGRPWGLGVLDEEARAAEGEIWGPALDELGLWDDDCRAEPGRQSYPLGDPRANCTRGNGRPDTEDLDGDGILTDRDGALFRYVVRLDGSSPFLVRRASETGTRCSGSTGSRSVERGQRSAGRGKRRGGGSVTCASRWRGGRRRVGAGTSSSRGCASWARAGRSATGTGSCGVFRATTSARRSRRSKPARPAPSPTAPATPRPRAPRSGSATPGRFFPARGRGSTSRRSASSTATSPPATGPRRTSVTPTRVATSWITANSASTPSPGRGGGTAASGSS